jgi:hypothetical protein
MKYLYSERYATLYYLNKGGALCGLPQFQNGTFDSEDWFVVELDNWEVPEGYYASIIAELTLAA